MDDQNHKNSKKLCEKNVKNRVQDYPNQEKINLKYKQHIYKI